MNKPILATGNELRVLHAVREVVGDELYETWFSHVRIIEEGDSVLLRTPNHFVLDWIRQNFTREIKQAVVATYGFSAEVRFAEDSEPMRLAPVPPVVLPNPAVLATSSKTGSPTQSIGDGSGFGSSYRPGAPEKESRATRDRNISFLQRHSNVPLNDEYSFANFVVGSGNRFCHAAALAVCDDPAKAYNPLFLHGSVGLGKTHLMQAICHGILERETRINVVYLTCERFVNEFISAIETGGLDRFRDNYRHVDVLLIDDIQFLGKKERTQEEFFHTFNALHENKRQIVLSSDCPPLEIPNLEARLVSRFKWGLVAEIHPPDYETRMAIIKKKSKLRGQELPDDVADYVATRIKTNIRELEGAVVKILAFAALMGREIDLDEAREALSDGSVIETPRLTCDRILEAICRYFSVSKNDIQSKSRQKSIAFPRQIGMYLARKNTNHSLDEIGTYFGNRDHSTVLYAADKIEKALVEDIGLRSTLTKLERQLKNRD